MTTRHGRYAGESPAQWVDPEGEPIPLQYDDAQDGQIVELADRQVLWCANDVQNTMVYRIHGWDGWTRLSGWLTRPPNWPAPELAGRGLAATFYATLDLTGPPRLERVDAQLWFGPIWGSFCAINEHPEWRHPWFAPGSPTPVDPATCSARWQGWLEPPVSEDFSFMVYTYGARETGAQVRLWVGGKLLVDSWAGVQRGPTPSRT